MSSSKLLTPIIHKTDETTPLPTDEPVFHLVTASGLYVCRNHEFFTSSVPTNQWPAELAPHTPSLQIRYPRLPQRDFELIIGFFAIIGEAFGAEAAVLLAWNPTQRRIEIVVPKQRSLVSSGWGGYTYPLSVDYQMPPLPHGWRWLGDLHSHAQEPAYASATDSHDELHRPGLHIVVGRISREPPELHIAAVVDGMRFIVRDQDTVIEGYERRRVSEVPSSWIDQVEVRRWTGSDQSEQIHPKQSSHPSPKIT